ncbi:quaternary amine ABC transporter ATP-binding protein [Leucobacter denitrificans]|uniref:Betaine/proline/choline family ABC transporter ATP-binding protein n=1 Tax=Leucobacter denitrificans TaxID=683042 RepID=A0A7G9S271_9MICO|nr:betaine/proline/choline family ABC transporter ATP-binding protein [Leucobacter denitrificans]QNN61946.1 betaine/proline/choline family ABC transporter ATP-binding protein [Leucobacter denitrificans]
MTMQEVRETAVGVGAGTSVTVKNLWKVFGPHAERVATKLQAGQDISDLAGHTVAVNDVSFSVSSGETFVVMGLSGSGKSTLVRCLTRLIEPTAGEVWIDDTEVRSLSSAALTEMRRKDWSMVFQHFGLLPHRRVLDNVAYSLEISGVPRAKRYARAREVIELVGLGKVEGKYPQELSGGMRQRVGLARALAVNPRLLLLDEPFSALDPLIRTDLQDELIRLARVMRQTSIFITHDLSEALKVGDRIAIMKDGKLVQVGTPEDIVLRPATEYVRRFAVEAPRAKVVKASAVTKPLIRVSDSETPGNILTKLEREGHRAVLLEGAETEPRLLVAEELLAAHVHGRALSEIAPKNDHSVNADARLESVMESLSAANGPVVVRSASGEAMGYVDEASVVRALSEKVEATDL